ncbi:hypothetical protein BO70DRAFT_394362 [Aspergillus heteromorphus CBS 117.55]|uniref:Uncharacterized protein n=1 Tax=Aspergillus heteromorphus CBS 117.55 TaxID=1448321 RepID=A0A317WP30_9EURO|nr:uncharacterized protein BO70DRAFT_394362 [Aspergillus heteromorphus CBS 117.55]PWY87471.1 hypothetical protein BO70DRAFT_394362 [Aspergillus heteromorphus CBS 117.55]
MVPPNHNAINDDGLRTAGLDGSSVAQPQWLFVVDAIIWLEARRLFDILSSRCSATNYSYSVLIFERHKIGQEESRSLAPLRGAWHLSTRSRSSLRSPDSLSPVTAVVLFLAATNAGFESSIAVTQQNLRLGESSTASPWEIHSRSQTMTVVAYRPPTDFLTTDIRSLA